MRPSKVDWDVFYASVKKRTGLDFHAYKAAQLQRRILGMAESRTCHSLGEFWIWLNEERGHLDWFLDKMAINVSELFRNPEKWEEVRRRVLPRLLSTKSRLKCWSAGCSYGAEALTLAMILDTDSPGPHQILGTDIDEAALAQAVTGKFAPSDVRAVPKAFLDRYLERAQDKWVADRKLMKYVAFKKQNLLADQFESGFDLIMCRNVVIYFTEETKASLYRRFYDALAPGGVLFVGSTERVLGASEIGFESLRPFFYQRPEQGETAWRNAS